MNVPSYRNFVEPLPILAEEVPDLVAFVYLEDGEHDESSLTFGQLHERALGVAHKLRAFARPGDRALLLLPPGLDYLAALFGCFYAGVIGVSAPPPQPRRLQRTLGRLLNIAESARVSTVLTTTPFTEPARAVIPEGHLLADARWLAADACPASTDTTVMANPAESEVAFLQYTSGSTADPRGVRLTHANLLDNSRFIAEAFHHDPEQSLGFNWIPPFHDMGLIGAILQPVYIGGFNFEEARQGRDPSRPASVLASPLEIVKRPIRWLRGVSRYRATTSGGPNFFYDICAQRIDEAECEGLDLSSWEVAFNGAEPIRVETMETFANKFASIGFSTNAFLPVYGLAEATLMVTAPAQAQPPTLARFDAEALLENRIEAGSEVDDPRLVGCGAPNPRHRLEIVDPETRLPAPADTGGEIWISGPSVADGYWGEGGGPNGMFGATLANGDQARFLRSGDLGAVYDGELYVIGRLSDMIILNGRNHHPHDVEVLAESVEPLLIPHSSAAFEVRSADDQPGVALVAESRVTDAEELQQAIGRVRTVIANELDLPLAIAVVCERGAVPKTTSGKIQRHLCRSLLAEGELEILAEWRLAGTNVAT